MTPSASIPVAANKSKLSNGEKLRNCSYLPVNKIKEISITAVTKRPKKLW